MPPVAGIATHAAIAWRAVTDPFDFDEDAQKAKESEQKAKGWFKAIWESILYALGVGGPAG